MAKRAKADAQDVKNRYATNKRHARGGMNDSKILRGWGAIELYAGESRKTLLRKGYPVQKDSGGFVIFFKNIFCLLPQAFVDDHKNFYGLRKNLPAFS